MVWYFYAKVNGDWVSGAAEVATFWDCLDLIIATFPSYRPEPYKIKEYTEEM